MNKLREKRISWIENSKGELKPVKIFHGGCLGCIVQVEYGIGNCANCIYSGSVTRDLPDLSIKRDGSSNKHIKFNEK